MLRTYKRVLEIMNTGIEVLVSALSVIMVATIFGQIVARFCFTTGVGWSEELARFLFIWIVFLGGSVGIHRKAHLGIETLTQKVSPAMRRRFAIISHALCLALFFMIVHYGLKILPLVGRQTAPGLQIPMSVPYLAIVVGGALMALHTAANLWEAVAAAPEETP